MMRQALLAFVTAAGLALAGCAGATGPEGANGADRCSNWPTGISFGNVSRLSCAGNLGDCLANPGVNGNNSVVGTICCQ